MTIKGKPAAEGRDYEARHLLVLEGREAVRKRPAMYIGSTDTRGLMHCLWEIIDNAVDEALGGFGDTIDVALNADGSIVVKDVARGIPTPVHYLPLLYVLAQRADGEPVRIFNATVISAISMTCVQIG